MAVRPPSRHLTLPSVATLLLAATALPLGQAHVTPESWSIAAPAPTGPVEGGGGSFVGPLYYYMGPGGGLSSFDPTAGTWTPLAPGTQHIEFTTAQARGPGGPVFIAIGGAGPGFPGCVPSPGGLCGGVDVYDVTTGTWSAGAPMPTPRAGLGAATIANRVYVVGGKDCIGTFCSGPFGPPSAGATHNVLEIYDPISNAWSTGPPMPTPVSDVYATAALGGKVYVFGGWDGVNDISDVQIFDTATGLWSLGTPMPTARSNAVAGACGDHIYVIGGFNSGAPLATVELYHPLTGVWSTSPPMPTARGELAAGDISNGADLMLAVTGRTASGPNDDNEMFHVPRCLSQGTMMHIGCGIAGPSPGATTSTPTLVVPGFLGVYQGPSPICGAGSPYGPGNPFYSMAGSCAAVPAGTAIPGAYCGPVSATGVVVCDAVVPPPAAGIIHGIMVGLDTNFDGWVDTSTGDLSSEAAPGTGTWTTTFVGAPPGRIIAFPVKYNTPAVVPLLALVTCT